MYLPESGNIYKRSIDHDSLGVTSWSCLRKYRLHAGDCDWRAMKPEKITVSLPLNGGLVQVATKNYEELKNPRKETLLDYHYKRGEKNQRTQGHLMLFI